MVVTLAIIDEARDELHEAGGVTYEAVTETGVSIRKRPQIEIILQFKKQLSLELSRFGLSPADRERVATIGANDANDPLDEFAIGGPGAA